MDIKKAKEYKIELEFKIADLINKFEEDTGADVGSLIIYGKSMLILNDKKTVAANIYIN